jgi:gas vesicle protein
MKRKVHKNHTKGSTGKVVTGILVGSVIGATVGLLMAPTSGEETRRKIKGEAMEAKQKLKTAAGNVESRARELAEEVRGNVDNVKESITPRKRAASTRN